MNSINPAHQSADLLTLRDVANRLRLSCNSIRNLISDGKLSGVKVLDRTMVQASEVERFVAGLPAAKLAPRKRPETRL